MTVWNLVDSTLPFKAVLNDRIGTTDAEWALIGPLLPAERGGGCRPADDNRPFFEGMMWMARTGAQWRLPSIGVWQMEENVPPLPSLGRNLSLIHI